MVGKLLSHYRIIEKLGSGGIGDVYQAFDERLQRNVALKVLRGASPSDQNGEARKKLRREALTLSRLSHPHIAHVYDFDSQDESDFLVMEFVAGETLAARLLQGSLAEKEVLRLGIQIAGALEAAHAERVIHCDLKPANIVLTLQGHAKVLDFGVARLLHSNVVDPAAATATI